MTVIDASVFVNALVVADRTGERARAELRGHAQLTVPAIFKAEVVSALRALVRRGELHPIRATLALGRVQSVRTIQYRFEPFAERVWELRDNLTVYDAWYVALAERLHTDLVTADERLANAAGPRCPMRMPGVAGHNLG